MDSNISDKEQKNNKTQRLWKIRSFILLGLLLGLLPSVVIEIVKWSNDRAILNLPAPDGLPAESADAFKRFKQELVFHFQGTTPTLANDKCVTIIDTRFMENEFPDYIFFHLDFHGSQHGRGWVAAMPRKEGPNWFFHNQTSIGKRDVVAFLAYSERKLQTEADAQTINEIVNVLSHNSFFTNKCEKVGELTWHLSIHPNENSTQFLEIGVDRDGNVESGMVTREQNK